MKPIYVFVTPFFPSENSWRGGYCFDMVRAIMETNRFQVHVYVAGAKEDYSYNGVAVHGFRHYSLPSGVAPFLMHWLNERSFLASLRRSGLDPRDVAICHVHTVNTAYAATAIKKVNRRTRFLLHHHCINPIRLSSGRLGVIPFHATLLYLYYVKICKAVDVNVFCSKKSERSFGSTYIDGVPENGFVDIRSQLLLGHFMPPLANSISYVYYNGFDTNLFNPTGRRHHQGLVIGCVSNFQPLKDIPTLIRAFALIHEKYPQSILRIVGSGQTQQECVRLIDRIGISKYVTIEPEMDHLQLPQFYKSLDVFALPSRTEGFCCSYMEALGCGTPIFGCVGVSVEEAFPAESRDMWLSPPLDAVGMAEKILSHLKHPSAVCLSRDFSTKVLADEFAEFIMLHN